jgi:hypothetical protein
MSIEPCLPYILNQVYYGVVGQYDIGDMSWDSGTKILTVQWGHELEPSEKVALDGVVTASIGKARIYKERTKIMDEIFWAAAADGGMPRVINLCNGLDKVPSLMAALDNYNYPLAQQRLGYALAQGWVTQVDHDLALSKIPEHEYE